MAKKNKSEQSTDVLLAWCIDRSGSMGWLKNDTIDGFNKFLEEQQGLPGNAWLSMILFDDTFQAPVVAMDISEVPPLTPQTYSVGGGTALYDAVGVTIDGIEGWLRNNPKFGGKVLVTIWTDGGENASKKWSRHIGGLKLMMDRIREKQDEGWIFSFLGSGGAAWTEGEQFAQTVGVANSTQVTNTSSGVRSSYAAASKGATALRAHGVYAGTSNYLREATTDSATMTNFGVEDVAEALAGTSNKTNGEEDDE